MKTRSIAVGDAVVLEDGRRGQVVLATKSGAHLLLRLKSTPLAKGAEPQYLLCATREARRINAWWNEASRRDAFAPDSRRAA